jgi:hypothetical protein
VNGLSNSLQDTIAKMLDLMSVMDHHVEHEFAQVDDHIKNLIGKLAAREDKSESRIDQLEALVKKVPLLVQCAFMCLCVGLNDCG